MTRQLDRQDKVDKALDVGIAVYGEKLMMTSEQARRFVCRKGIDLTERQWEKESTGSVALLRPSGAGSLGAETAFWKLRDVLDRLHLCCVDDSLLVRDDAKKLARVYGLEALPGAARLFGGNLYYSYHVIRDEGEGAVRAR